MDSDDDEDERTNSLDPGNVMHAALERFHSRASLISLKHNMSNHGVLYSALKATLSSKMGVFPDEH